MSLTGDSMQYAGEVVGTAEAKKRSLNKFANDQNHLLILREFMCVPCHKAS